MNFKSYFVSNGYGNIVVIQQWSQKKKKINKDCDLAVDQVTRFVTRKFCKFILLNDVLNDFMINANTNQRTKCYLLTRWHFSGVIEF